MFDAALRVAQLLGLALCRQILQRYGGAIDLLPGTGDTGVAFRVTFPAT